MGASEGRLRDHVDLAATSRRRNGSRRPDLTPPLSPPPNYQDAAPPSPVIGRVGAEPCGGRGEEGCGSREVGHGARGQPGG